MKHRSSSRPVGVVVVVVGAVSALLVSAPVAGADVPGELQRLVGEAAPPVPELQKPPTAPAARGPSRPASKPSRPAPATPRPNPPPADASPAAPRPARQVGGARATSSQADDPSGQGPSQGSPPATGGASGGATAADAPDAADPTTRPVAAQAGDLGEQDATTLPFTGFRILPMLLMAVLALMAGIGLRRAVRRPA
jgi:hypothetical protein